MPNIIVPGSTAYGNSFARPFGNLISESKTRGVIVPSELNKSELSDEVELNSFEKTIRSFILGMLGSPVVRVELTDSQLKIAIDTAINKLNYHIPYWCTQFAVFNTSPGVNLYELPTYMLDNLIFVAYKKSLMSTMNMANSLEFDYFLNYFKDNYSFGTFSMGDFYLLQSHLEMTKRILGQDGSFDIVDGKYLQIYPIPVTGDQEVVLEYRALDSETMHPGYRLWINKYALACAKEILGRVRGKFNSGLPSPAGGVKLDGESLVMEAKKEQEELYKELMMSIEEPSLPSWG